MIDSLRAYAKSLIAQISVIHVIKIAERGMLVLPHTS